MTDPDEDERAALLREAIRLKRSGAGRGVAQLPPRAEAETPLLGEAQRSLWLLHQLEPDSPAYNLASSFRVRGALDRARLERCLEQLTARHRILRSTFRASGATVEQVVHPPAALAVERVAADPGGALEAAVREARRPFDLEAGPLLRLLVVEEASTETQLLLLVVHHILADERSLEVLWEELAEAYAGRSRGLEPTVQYDDYVAWRAGRGAEERAAGRAWWRARLDPLPEDLALPFESSVAAPRTPDGARAGGQGREGAEARAPSGRLLVSAPNTTAGARIRKLAASTGATPFAVYAFAFRLLLQRITGGRRIAFATPVSTRSHPATARMIGYFLNPVVVDSAIDEQRTVESAIEAFNADLRELLSHAAVPFDAVAEKLAEELVAPRPRDRHPVFQTMFVYQQATRALALDGVQLDPLTLDLGESKFDLTLFVTDGEDALEVAVEYRTERFAACWMQRLLGHFETLLERLGEQPGRRTAEVSLLGLDEERELRRFSEGEALDTDGAPLLPEQILRSIQATPDAPAIASGGVHWSYGELEQAARAIARELVQRGVSPGDRVGVFLERGAWMIAGLLGCHWAGAAYVPLDPGYPAARNQGVLEDAGVAAVLTSRRRASELPTGAWPAVCVDELSTARPESLAGQEHATPRELAPESTAYVLYTSGSTGRPKGVVVSHGNLRASTAARFRVYDEPPQRFLLLSSVAFDSSVAGIFWTLAAGGTLVVPTDEQASEPERLARLVVDERVTALLCVPSLYAYLVKIAADRLLGLEFAIVAGESCPSRLVADHFRALPEVRLYNEYGPTETTVWATVHEFSASDADRTVTIGRPVPGLRVEVLDCLGRRVPAGVPGEAWIAGPSVAQGYWRRQELTDERFASGTRGPDPRGQASGERRFLTGDRMTWTLEGNLLFHGRADEQIKLRGFRIEPGEIEALLLEVPGVEEAAVVARTSGAGTGGEREATQLVAFLETPAPRSETELREHLAQRLPDFMVPHRFVPMAALPRLPNGKVDRNGLRAMELEPEAPAPAGRVPSDGEQALLSLWEGLLGRFGIGLRDNFFVLGGHSLLAVEMAAAIQSDFGVSLLAAEVFQNPTVEELAQRIESERDPDAPSFAHLFPIQPRGQGTPLVFCVPHFFSETFATHFRGERPVYGLRGVSLRQEGNLGRWRSMTELAEELVDEVQQRFGNAPLLVAGYSFGGSMAVEAVRVMEQRGLPVRRLFLIAPMPLDLYRLGPLRLQLGSLRKPLEELTRGEALRLWLRTNDPRTRRPYQRIWMLLTLKPWRKLLCTVGKLRRALGLPLTPRILHADVRVDRFRLHAGYHPGVVRTPTVIFSAMESETDAAATWRPVFQGPLTVHATPDPHLGADSLEAARELILAHLDELDA